MSDPTNIPPSQSLTKEAEAISQDDQLEVVALIRLCSHGHEDQVTLGFIGVYEGPELHGKQD